MKDFKTRIATILFLSTLSLSTSAYPQITPSADAYTNTADPATNYGAATLLYVDGVTEISYIQFNLSSIPTGANVSQATLKLYVNAVTKAGSFNVDYVSGAWAESTITSSLAPTFGTTIVSSVPITTASKNQYILIDITPAVVAWLNGSVANDGIALVANGTFNANFDSKENTTTSHPAELDIVFAGGGTLTGITTASGSGLIGGGTNGTLNLSLTNACATNQVLQWNGTAWVCTNLSGGGTITGVTAGIDLNGGGTSGTVTLNLDTTKVPQLNAANTFAGNQIVNGNLIATGYFGVGTATPGVRAEIANGGTPYNLYLSGSSPSLYFGGVSGMFPNGSPQTSAGYIALATTAGSYYAQTGDLIVATQSFQSGNSNAIRFMTPINDSGLYGPAMSILRNGNVGIGTTTPGTPLAISATNGTQATGWALAAVTGTSEYGVLLGASSGVGAVQGFNGGAASLVLQPVGGNVGISTTAPSQLLTIGVENGTAPSPEQAIRINSGGYGEPGAFDTPSNGDKLVLYDSVAATYDARIGVGNVGDMWFKSSGSAASSGIFRWFSGPTPSEVMTILGNGNVGIGTAAPTTTLDVIGSVKVEGAGNGIVFPNGTVQTTAASDHTFAVCSSLQAHQPACGCTHQLSQQGISNGSSCQVTADSGSCSAVSTGGLNGVTYGTCCVCSPI